MQHLPPKQTQSLILALSLLVLAALACTTSNNGNSPSPNSPPPKFNFAVTVRDRDNNAIGQATVLLAVGPETVAQVLTDDNGQANFSVDGGYYGKRARIYAKSPDYHPADLEVALTTESRMILQLISKKNPKIDPDPPEPAPVSGSQPKTAPTRKPASPLEVFAPGESKTGSIADEQVIDYRFEASENVALVFTGQSSVEPYVEFNIEIYDSQGFPKKRIGVNGGRTVQMSFTPPNTGSFILRLRGTERFGTFLISMQELK
jgi:hypothetical protein